MFQKMIFIISLLISSSVLAQGSMSDTGYGTQQYLHNANFDLWQRATSVNQTINGPTCGTACGVTAADRWFLNYGGSLGSLLYTLSRQSFTTGQTEVPNEPTYFFRLNITGCCSSNPTALTIGQKMEDVRTLAGRTVTVSFYGRSTVTTSTPIIKFYQYFGTGGSPSTSVTVTCTALSAWTTSWKKYVSTCSIPSLVGKTIGTDTTLTGTPYLWMMIFVGDVVQQVDLSQVMLNTGDSPAPFALAGNDAQGELSKSQRFYEKSFPVGDAPNTNPSYLINFLCGANGITGSTASAEFVFKVTKRRTPTITICGYGGSCATGLTTLPYNIAGNTTPFTDGNLGYTHTVGFEFIPNQATTTCKVLNWAADAEL